MTNNKNEVMEVLTGPERRRRWSAEEKLAIVRETFEPGKTVLMVARLHGINPNQLLQWRKLHQDGSLSAVSAGEEVVPASELGDALKQIKELQRLLGKKTMENEILREAAEAMKSRNGLRAHPHCRGNGMNVSHPPDPRESAQRTLDPHGPTASKCPGWKIIKIFAGKPEHPHEAYASWD
jgi:transposase